MFSKKNRMPELFVGGGRICSKNVWDVTTYASLLALTNVPIMLKLLLAVTHNAILNAKANVPH